jgi:hypothetical protein
MADDRKARLQRLRAVWERARGYLTRLRLLHLTSEHHHESRDDPNAPQSPRPEPIWCVVANVVAERRCGPGRTELRRGTKHFAAGAKVYCFPPLWGDGYERIKVVGRHRGSHRYVTIVIRSEWLTGWKVQLVYSPHVIGEMPDWDSSTESKEKAEVIVRGMQERVSRASTA